MSIKSILLATAGVAVLGLTNAMAGGPEPLPPPPPCLHGVYIEGNLGWATSKWGIAVDELTPDQIMSGAAVQGVGPLVLLSRHVGEGDGLAYGGDFGYIFNQYLALEGGMFGLPSVHFHTTVQSGSQTTGQFVNPTTTDTLETEGKFRDNYFLYSALKVMLPLFPNFDIFFKGGVGYRDGRLKLEDTLTEDRETDTAPVTTITTTTVVHSKATLGHWRPMVAAGGEYHFLPNWVINAQFTFIPQRVTDLDSRRGAMVIGAASGGTPTTTDPTLVFDSPEEQSITVPHVFMVTGGLGYIFAT